ncbi:MAG: flap endonuclease-1 [Nanoarchaeota archaeon]|nr:flap endonuclease-1 [Nanoarchaeota archaeon]
MGLNIGDIVPRTSLEFKDLKGKIVVVDAFNTLYQFLSTVRQPDGTPLMDDKGRTTSHLSGLFYRNINLLQEGMKLVYVFDGKPPELKGLTHQNREKVKEEAKEKYEKAKKEEDVLLMGKYARQLARLTKDMIDESKELLKAMGIAVVQAPSEGESQAAYLAQKIDAYVGSQDYDSLLFGAPKLIQNLTLARKRKIATGFVYISPEIIELSKVMNSLQLNMDQLICLGILCGTDYNPGGVRGIGQKRALDLVKKLKQPVLIFDSVKAQIEGQENRFDWQEIFELFHKPHIDKDVEIEWPKIDEDKIKDILVKEHDFSEDRIESALKRLNKAKEAGQQKTLF